MPLLLLGWRLMPKSGILQAGTRALGYDIITLINAGQFGEVYEVFDSAMGRRSALKLIEVTDPASHKAVVEAQAHYLCSHNNVVEIITADEISAGPISYVAIEMEYIPEGSLEDRIRSGFLSCKEAVHHLKQVLFALEHAHNQGIVHRDVKPGNIMLARPHTKLSDFGTVIHPVSGTRVVDEFYRPHAPPEALNFDDFSPLCDIYAAGMTLLRAVNNIQDWTACLASMGDWNSIAKNGKLASRIGFDRHVPRSLRGIINRACNADPTKRFSSAAALRGVLEGLRFAHDWKRISEDEWTSEKGQRIERILLNCGPRYEVVYTINNRRDNARCKKFTKETDARTYLCNLVYDTTLA
jgi:serine/threonine protein kinase